MRGPGRISLALTTVLVLCTWASAPAFADGGPKKDDGRRASAANAGLGSEGRSKSKRAAASRSRTPVGLAGERARVVGDRAGPKVRFTWPRLTRRYQILVTESRKRERRIERSHKQIQRDLAHLYRMRIYILNAADNATRKTRPQRPERPDPVLVQVANVRKRVGQAAFTSRAALTKTLVTVRTSFQRLDRECRAVRGASPKATAGEARVAARLDLDRAGPNRNGPNRNASLPLGNRIETEATTALGRMNGCTQAYFRVDAAERKRVQKLAGQTERLARELLKRQVKRQAVRGSTTKVRAGATDLRRALDRLERMESAKRRALRMRRLQDARRIQQLEKSVAAIKKEVKAMEQKLRRLRRLKERGQPKPPTPLKRAGERVATPPDPERAH